MINFPEVENSVKKLKTQLAQGEMDEQTFEKCLLDLIDLAEDGYYWMFGHKSERWFRHDGEQWIPDDPGGILITLTDVTSKESPEAEWRSVNWGWFIVSLIIITVIGAIVYYSAL